MRAIDVYAELRRFTKPVLTTEDAAVRTRVSLSAASRMPGGLAAKGLVHLLRRGLWALDSDIHPLLLPENLTVPLPSYVSLQTALHRHGMIEQIPRVVYAASPARMRSSCSVSTGDDIVAIIALRLHRIHSRFRVIRDFAPRGGRNESVARDAVSLASTRRIVTLIATCSIHRVAPESRPT